MKITLNKLIHVGKQTLKPILPGHSPNFIIIGAQKSGTSSLHYYLSQHPQLIASRNKEINYFDRWINHGYDLKWYENHFNSLVKNRKLFFESTPNYIYCEDAAKIIYENYPKIKLILLLRNPIDRAYSAWNMYRDMFKKNKPDFSKREGRYPNELNPIHKYLMMDRKIFPTFKEAMKIELGIMENKISYEPAILRRGIYIDQLKNYLKYFRLDQFHIIGFGDLKKDINSVLRDISNFLELGKPFTNIDLSPINSRKYYKIIDQKDYEFLLNFYRKPNIELFTFLGKELNW